MHRPSAAGPWRGIATGNRCSARRSHHSQPMLPNALCRPILLNGTAPHVGYILLPALICPVSSAGHLHGHRYRLTYALCADSQFTLACNACAVARTSQLPPETKLRARSGGVLPRPLACAFPQGTPKCVLHPGIELHSAVTEWTPVRWLRVCEHRSYAIVTSRVIWTFPSTTQTPALAATHRPLRLFHRRPFDNERRRFCVGEKTYRGSK